MARMRKFGTARLVCMSRSRESLSEDGVGLSLLMIRKVGHSTLIVQFGKDRKRNGRDDTY